MGYYKSVSAMGKDIDLMAKNAKTYNEPGSQVFKVCPFLCVNFFNLLLSRITTTKLLKQCVVIL